MSRLAPVDSTAPVGRLLAAVDAVAAGLLVLSLSTVFTGGFRAELVGVRVSVTSWLRPAAVALLLLAIRHWWRRSPSAASHALDTFRRWRLDPVTRATWAMVVATRVGVLAVGLMATHAIGFPQGRAPFRVADTELGNLPARFDAGWYLTIATTGYRFNPNTEREQNLVFFPAFPTLMRWAALVMGRQVLWAGTIVSIIAFAWAARYLYRLAREMMDDDRAQAAVMLLCLYPFAVFFSAPYTEALFLLTMLGAWYHMRRDERWPAFFWGLVAGLTRPNGCLLSIPLALVAVAPLWHERQWRRPPGGWSGLVDRLMVAAAPGLGMLLYSAYVYDLTGDPLMWARLQGAWGRDNIGVLNFLGGEWRSVAEQGLSHYVASNIPDFLNLSAAALVMAAVVPVWRRFGVAPAVLLLVNLLPALGSGGWLSVGRATSVLFPVFLWLGDVVPPRHRPVAAAIGAGLQAFVAVLFFTWRPLF